MTVVLGCVVMGDSGVPGGVWAAVAAVFVFGPPRSRPEA